MAGRPDAARTYHGSAVRSTTDGGADAGGGTPAATAMTAGEGAGRQAGQSGPIAGTPDAAPEPLVLHDFDDDRRWPGYNALGNWAGAGGFANGGDGEVVDGALRLESAAGGWLQSSVTRDLPGVDRLTLGVRDDAGGEEDAFAVELGRASDVCAQLTHEAVGTSTTVVLIDVEAAGMGATSPDALYLDFGAGAAADVAVEIEEIRFERAREQTRIEQARD